jgi:hypothetical protein
VEELNPTLVDFTIAHREKHWHLIKPTITCKFILPTQSDPLHTLSYLQRKKFAVKFEIRICKENKME